MSVLEAELTGSMRVKLKVVQGKPEGKEITLAGDRFVIGRGEECQLRPNSELVSRTHCAVYVQADRVWVRDLGSRNGTQVNGQSIKGDVDLKTGDLVQVGPLVFSVTLLDAPQPAAQPPTAAPSAKPAAGTETIAEPAAQALKKPLTPAAKPEPASASAASPPLVVKGGAAEQDSSNDQASDADISAWLVSDTQHAPPADPADVYGGDTKTFNALDDTTPDGPRPPQLTSDPDAPSKGKKDPGAGKRKAIVPEATSQAAADILRKFLTRRPEQ